MPYNKAAFISLVVLKVILLGVSVKWPKVAQSYLYITALFILSSLLLPLDLGGARSPTLLAVSILYSLLNYFCLSFNYWASLLTILGTVILKFFIIDPLIYPDLEFSAVTIVTLVTYQLTVVYICTVCYFMYSLAGHIYVTQCIQIIGNDQLLNSLEKGVAIFERSSGKVTFANSVAQSTLSFEPAKHKNQNFGSEYDLVINADKKQFCMIDPDLVSCQIDIEAKNIIAKILDCDVWISLKELIQDQISRSGPAEKFYFRVLSIEFPGLRALAASRFSLGQRRYPSVKDISGKLICGRLRAQMYNGVPCYALLFKDVTHKVQSRLQFKIDTENKLQAQ